MRLGSSLGVVLAAAAVASATPLVHHAPKCRSVNLTVHAEADNIHFTAPPDQNNATDIQQWLFAALQDPSGSYKNGTEHVSGTWSVLGTYCEPRGKARKKRTLQVLVHGITYNKELWAGLGFSNDYNWHMYATDAGYHTLAVNRLGHGQLTGLPNPITEDQSALQDAYTEKLLVKLRQGTFPGLPSFHKIVYVGHSFGSALGNHVAASNPAAADALVLTGYSSTVALPIALTLDFFSAAIVNPARFPGVPLGYWAGQTESVRTAAFYAGAYDPGLPPVDFQTHDTFAVGEGLSPGFEPRVTSFTGPVLVVTGNLDQLFCPGGSSACPATLSATGSLFPLAANYSVMMPNNTGHTLSLHLSAPQMIEDVHDWLDTYF